MLECLDEVIHIDLPTVVRCNGYQHLWDRASACRYLFVTAPVAIGIRDSDVGSGRYIGGALAKDFLDFIDRTLDLCKCLRGASPYK